MANVVEVDPVEQHILAAYQKLKEENQHLKDLLKQSGSWAEMKSIEEWGPHDFLSYFMTRYQTKYRVQYSSSGSKVRHGIEIEDFLEDHNISHEDYKFFLDMIFDRLYHAHMRPTVAHMYSISLYNKAMDTTLEPIPSLHKKLKQADKEFTSNPCSLRDRLRIANQQFDQLQQK